LIEPRGKRSGREILLLGKASDSPEDGGGFLKAGGQLDLHLKEKKKSDKRGGAGNPQFCRAWDQSLSGPSAEIGLHRAGESA